MKVENINGFEVVIYNEVDDRKDYYISYNPHDTAIYGCDTTALVRGQMERFYILNGDHRAAYAGLKTYRACLRYFKEHADQMSKRSDVLDDKDEEVCHG